MSDKVGKIRIMFAALACTIGPAHAQANAPQATVVLQCAGTLKVSGVAVPEESGVILDFEKRLVFHRGQTYRIEDVTESFVAFATYDDAKHIKSLMGGLDRVTGTFSLSGTPESGLQWHEELKCTRTERRF
jgi:hypothetical protein